MLNRENIIKCRYVLEKFGYRQQTMMVIEECSELIRACSDLQKAACKKMRYENADEETQKMLDENFKEELTDVLVMATQGCLMCGISEADINRRAAEKLNKVLDR